MALKRQVESKTQPQLDWASVATSSPFADKNRSEMTDEHSDADQFIDYRSRCNKRRRYPTGSPKQQQWSADSQHQQQQQQCGAGTEIHQQHSGQQPDQQCHRRGGRLLKGSASSVRGPAAAKYFVDKAVYCVDNVDPSITTDDLAAFVQGMSVTVISCFRAARRRFHGESGPITDRAAFRLHCSCR